MLTEPLLSPNTTKALHSIVTRPPHALLITGHPGSGKRTTATWLAEQLLSVTTEQLTSHPYFITVSPDGSSITIEQLRSLERRLRLRVATDTRQPITRLVVIEQADVMTIEAQNALLKTLEEPPQGTMLLLTADRSADLLPTVLSRVQTVHIGLPDRQALRDMLRQMGQSTQDIDRIIAMSGGLPGLAMSLAQQTADHPLMIAALTARKLLQSSSFERLAAIDSLSKDKLRARQTITMLMQMSHAALLDGKATARWQQVMQAAYDADKALEANAQPKLALSRLMLTL